MKNMIRICGLVLAIVLTGVSAQAAMLQGIHVNFQISGTDIPEGYIPDYGDAYGLRPIYPGSSYAYGTYGWSEDNTGNARDRDQSGVEQRWDTLNHMQQGGTFSWEIELENGLYDIYLAAGDPSHTDQINNILVEGIELIDPDGQDNADEFYLYGVSVTDGRLTLSPGEGASNAKLAFIHITPVPEPASMAVVGLGGLGVLLRRRRK